MGKSDDDALERIATAYGFGYYKSGARARADDLLVRQAASASLTAAADAVASLEQDYRRRFVPPSTREQPFPPADVLQGGRDLAALKSRIGGLDALVRGASAPTADHVWKRLRNETVTLEALLSYDRLLIGRAAAVLDAAAQIDLGAWRAGAGRDAIESAIAAAQQTLSAREKLLLAGGI